MSAPQLDYIDLKTHQTYNRKIIHTFIATLKSGFNQFYNNKYFLPNVKLLTIN